MTIDGPSLINKSLDELIDSAAWHRRREDSQKGNPTINNDRKMIVIYQLIWTAEIGNKLHWNKLLLCIICVTQPHNDVPNF